MSGSAGCLGDGSHQAAGSASRSSTQRTISSKSCCGVHAFVAQPSVGVTKGRDEAGQQERFLPSITNKLMTSPTVQEDRTKRDGDSEPAGVKVPWGVPGFSTAC